MQQRRAELAAVIQLIFDATHHTYGYRRMHAELRRQGVGVDDELVRILMREQGLVPVQQRRKRPGLTRADAAAGPIPDLVGRDFTADAPGAKLVGDITEIPTDTGRLYLATVIDCYSKAVVGYAINTTYPTGLCIAALDAARHTIPIQPAAIFHSDRGSQYTSHEFAAYLHRHDMKQSVGRTGICYDNAMAESFFGKLKPEWIDQKHYTTREEAKRDIIHYIEGFYNTTRLHSALDYRPPYEKLSEWYGMTEAA